MPFSWREVGSRGQFVFGCPLRCCDKVLVFTAQIKVTETHYALQLRCSSEEEALWFYCKANLPEPTLGTIHMSYLPWDKHMPLLLEKARSVTARIIPDPSHRATRVKTQ